jgi:hypothetical protein
MPAWLFGVAIALLVGSAATAYLWLVRRRDDETAAGLLALAGMRWRDFSRLVLEAMGTRGLERVSAISEEPQEHSASFMLSGQGRRVLLACKHGSAYRIGSATMEEIASEVRLRGAQGGILVTEGTLDRSGLDKAEKHSIEVLDGTRLWPEVKPLVEAKLRQRIVGNATARARRHIGISWLGAMTLGLASALVFPGVIGSRGTETPTVPGAATPVEQNRPAGTAPTGTITAPAEAAPPRSAAELEQDRSEISRTLARTDGISRGVWISRSTLSVDREVGEEAAFTLVCAQLAKYPELSLTRVQMNPPIDSGEQVRWRQCQVQ